GAVGFQFCRETFNLFRFAFDGSFNYCGLLVDFIQHQRHKILVIPPKYILSGMENAGHAEKIEHADIFGNKSACSIFSACPAFSIPPINRRSERITPNSLLFQSVISILELFVTRIALQSFNGGSPATDEPRQLSAQ